MASGAQSHDRTFVATHSIDDGSNTALIVSPADAGPFDAVVQNVAPTIPLSVRPYTKKEGVYFKLTIAQLDRRKGHVVVYSRISQVNATQPAFCYLISFNLTGRRGKFAKIDCQFNGGHLTKVDVQHGKEPVGGVRGAYPLGILRQVRQKTYVITTHTLRPMGPPGSSIASPTVTSANSSSSSQTSTPGPGYVVPVTRYHQVSQLMGFQNPQSQMVSQMIGQSTIEEWTINHNRFVEEKSRLPQPQVPLQALTQADEKIEQPVLIQPPPLSPNSLPVSPDAQARSLPMSPDSSLSSMDSQARALVSPNSQQRLSPLSRSSSHPIEIMSDRSLMGVSPTASKRARPLDAAVQPPRSAPAASSTNYEHAPDHTQCAVANAFILPASARTQGAVECIRPILCKFLMAHVVHLADCPVVAAHDGNLARSGATFNSFLQKLGTYKNRFNGANQCCVEAAETMLKQLTGANIARRSPVDEDSTEPFSWTSRKFIQLLNGPQVDTTQEVKFDIYLQNVFENYFVEAPCIASIPVRRDIRPHVIFPEVLHMNELGVSSFVPSVPMRLRHRIIGAMIEVKVPQAQQPSLQYIPFNRACRTDWDQSDGYWKPRGGDVVSIFYGSAHVPALKECLDDGYDPIVLPHFNAPATRKRVVVDYSQHTPPSRLPNLMIGAFKMIQFKRSLTREVNRPKLAYIHSMSEEDKTDEGEFLRWHGGQPNQDIDDAVTDSDVSMASPSDPNGRASALPLQYPQHPLWFLAINRPNAVLHARIDQSHVYYGYGKLTNVVQQWTIMAGAEDQAGNPLDDRMDYDLPGQGGDKQSNAGSSSSNSHTSARHGDKNEPNNWFADYALCPHHEGMEEFNFKPVPLSRTKQQNGSKSRSRRSKSPGKKQKKQTKKGKGKQVATEELEDNRPCLVCLIERFWPRVGPHADKMSQYRTRRLKPTQM